jgi:erythronate-4-phosphate dehydrogenase
MRILADENIPFAAEVFSSLGAVQALSGREMTRDTVRDAELLFVRSVTDVGEELLDGSRVKFVATATIGTDHVDTCYLASRGIGFASAPGSNARSVAEYVCAALLVLEGRGVVRLEGSTIGIVGVGNVGTRIAALAEALGLRVLLNDPPRARAQRGGAFVPLSEIAASSDIVTFHTPLERAGRDPTHHLVDAGFLETLKPGVVVINSSRGAVADTAALKSAAAGGKLGALVLDVWEHEPQIDCDLLSAADLATPHIAGYSYDGKVAGTRMIYEAACRFLGREPSWPPTIPARQDLSAHIEGGTLLDAVRASYDIEADDRRMRHAHRGGDAAERAEEFRRLRKEYPVRREFANWRITLGPQAESIRGRLKAVGFDMAAT